MSMLSKGFSMLMLMSLVSTETGPSDEVTEILPWRITNGVEFTFPSNVILTDGEHVLIVEDLDAFTAHYTDVPEGTKIYQWASGNLSNGGEKIDLSIPGDKEWQRKRFYIRQDRVNYNDAGGWPMQADGYGKSLTRINQDQYGNDIINWQAAEPSPGTSQ